MMALKHLSVGKGGVEPKWKYSGRTTIQLAVSKAQTHFPLIQIQAKAMTNTKSELLIEIFKNTRILRTSMLSRMNWTQNWSNENKTTKKYYRDYITKNHIKLTDTIYTIYTN